MMTLHEFLDCNYGTDGDSALRQRLENGADANAIDGLNSETPLQVATRRRRETAVAILLDHGADIDAKTDYGKTAYAHAVRRGFSELVTLLTERGGNTELNDADRFAVAIVNGYLDEARKIFASIRTWFVRATPKKTDCLPMLLDATTRSRSRC